MAEQQLVDYLKKAREAGQADQQSRALLSKNGWTDAEISDAFSALSQQVRPQQAQAQKPAQPQQQNQANARAQQQPAYSQDFAKEKPFQQARPEQQERPAQSFQERPASQPSVSVQPSQSAKTQYQPQQTRPAQSNMYPRNSSGKHIGTAIFSIVLFLLIIGAAAFAYALYAGIYNPSWNPFETGPNPELVVSKMAESLKNVKTWHSEALIKAAIIDSASGSSGVINAALKIDNDFTDSANPKISMALSGKFTPQEIATAVASADADIIISGGKSYIQLKNFVAPEEAGIDVSQILGKWLVFDENSAEMLSLDFQPQSLMAMPGNFSFIKKIDNQQVSGKDTYHYLVNTDAGQTEVWIGKEDYMLYGYKTIKIINTGDFAPDSAVKLDIDLSVVNSRFNESVAVAEPASAQKFEDIIAPVIKTEKVRADLARISDIAESIFDSDLSGGYATLCTRGLLNGYEETYGQELVDLHKDIISQGAGKSACYSSASNYCVSTQLADGKFACVGKDGAKGSTKCLSASAVCK